MLTTAFDISNDEPGDDQHNFLIIAGFIGYAQHWKQFDSEWRERLKVDGVPYFHMQRFAQSSEMFKGWDKQEPRRRRLIADLLEIIRSNAVRKFGVVVQAPAADAVFFDNASYRHKMLQVGVTTIVAQVESWRCREHIPYSPEYVFEDGDPGKHVMDVTVRNIIGKDPIRRPKKGPNAFTPLQAADLFAFEVKSVYEDGPRPAPDGYRFRVPYEVLNKMEEDATVFDKGTADFLNPYFDMDRYFKKNPLTPE